MIYLLCATLYPVCLELSENQYIYCWVTSYEALPLDTSFDSSGDQATMAMRSDGGEHPKRAGERVCQYFLQTGTCKFGVTCKFDHPRNSGGSSSDLLLNYHGYPLRPGEQECFYYMRMGQCKFGICCKFHHPDPAGVHPESTVISVPPTAPPFYPGSACARFRMPMPPPLPGLFVSGRYGTMLLPTGLVPIPSWTSYSVPLSPALSPNAQHSAAAGSLYGVATLPSTPTSNGPYSPMWSPTTGQSSTDFREVKFPERPGQPECQYYLRTGDCKFGSSCRFHHPPERPAFMTSCCLSPLGLPSRPGEKPCAFYMRNGFCRFGITCKFDHPMELSSAMKQSSDPSGSSLPLLPTSLSPDLSPQAVRISSSEATSTSLVTLTLSETTPASASNI